MPKMPTCNNEQCIQGLVRICSFNQNVFWKLTTKGKSCCFFTHSSLCSDRLLYAAPVSIAQQRATESALFNVKRYSENIPAGHRHCRWYSARERRIRSKGQNLLKKGEKMHYYQKCRHSQIYYKKKTNCIKHITGFHLKDLNKTLLLPTSPSFAVFQEVVSISSFPESTNINGVYSRSDGINSVQLQCIMGELRTGHSTEYKKTPKMP